MTIDSHQHVRRRHVFFISGFDPKGAAHYHALYQSESVKQALVNGTTIKVGPRTRDHAGNSGWTVNAMSTNEGLCDTSYEFLRWDDIVRRHWPRSLWRLLLDLVHAYWLIVTSGELPTVWNLSRRTLVGLVYPIVVLGGGLALATALGLVAAVVLHNNGLSIFAASFASLLLWVLTLWGTYKLESRLNTTWLVRIFSFTAKQARGQLPELEARLDAIAARIHQKIRANDVHEILIVGFSVGSILAVSAVGRALLVKPTSNNEARPSLSLLTLGHCIPLVGLYPPAHVFRSELDLLAQCQSVKWIDFSSVTDWGSFALVDPVNACKINLPTAAKCNPIMKSPRFHTMFPAATYAVLNRNKRRMHMQYLMAGELPSDYDYFAITSGAHTLGDRYPTMPTQ